MTKKLRFAPKSKEELKKIILKNKDKKIIFNFLNLYSVYLYRKNKDFRDAMLKAKTNSITIPDGFMVSLFLGCQRLQGPKFTREFLNEKSIKNKKHFFLGSDSANPKDMAKIIKFFGLDEKKVKYYNPPYIQGFLFPKEEIEKMIIKINKENPDYLWISLTNPKQEILAQQIYDKIDAKHILNVGSALDFISQRKKESPEIVRRIGLEWLYRGVTDLKHSRKKIWGSFIGLFYLPRTVELKKN